MALVQHHRAGAPVACREQAKCLVAQPMNTRVSGLQRVAIKQSVSRHSSKAVATRAPVSRYEDCLTLFDLQVAGIPANQGSHTCVRGPKANWC